MDSVPVPAEIEGWGEYRKLILAELERLAAGVDQVNRKVDELRARDLAEAQVEIAMLKVKAGLWGGVAGAVPALVMALLWYLEK